MRQEEKNISSTIIKYNMSQEVCGKGKKIYQMFNEFKIEAESLLSRIQAVDKFTFIDTDKEHIFDFVRICNYLLTEYDFINLSPVPKS